jgi:hypothetical protein
MARSYWTMWDVRREILSGCSGVPLAFRPIDLVLDDFLLHPRRFEYRV